jgi:UDP-N-acetylbacillosamine transaminase
MFEFYKEQLSDIEEISFMPEVTGSLGNRCLTTLIFEKTDPLKVVEALEKVNAESRPLWKPMHLQELFSSNKAFVDGTSEAMFEKGLCLPSPTKSSNDDLMRVVEVIKSLCR